MPDLGCSTRLLGIKVRVQINFVGGVWHACRVLCSFEEPLWAACSLTRRLSPCASCKFFCTLSLSLFKLHCIEGTYFKTFESHKLNSWGIFFFVFVFFISKYISYFLCCRPTHLFYYCMSGRSRRVMHSHSLQMYEWWDRNAFWRRYVIPEIFHSKDK